MEATLKQTVTLNLSIFANINMAPLSALSARLARFVRLIRLVPYFA
jgi:hypothetical protein